MIDKLEGSTEAPGHSNKWEKMRNGDCAWVSCPFALHRLVPGMKEREGLLVSIRQHQTVSYNKHVHNEHCMTNEAHTPVPT